MEQAALLGRAVNVGNPRNVTVAAYMLEFCSSRRVASSIGKHPCPMSRQDAVFAYRTFIVAQ